MTTLMTALNLAESEYKLYRFQNQLQQAQFLLTVDWKKINDERVEMGLPKISNESQRSAYIKDKYATDNEEELSLELKYNQARREYEHESYRRLSEAHKDH